MRYLHYEYVKPEKNAPVKRERQRYQLLSDIVILGVKLARFMPVAVVIISLLTRWRKASGRQKYTDTRRR